MLNMIKLDWLGMKYYWISIVVLPIMVCFIVLLSEALIIPVVAFAMLSFSVNPFAVEEKGKLDNLYLTLPVTRKTIVNARFGLSLIMQFAGLAFGTFITVILSALLYGRTILFEHNFRADFDVMFLIICVSLLLYAVMNLSMFPILFKIGYAKGKAFGFYVPLGVLMVAACFFIFLWNHNDSIRTRLISAFEWSLANTIWAAVIILAASVIFFLISYTLSQRLYSRREF
jgi:hypothetical protein